jgi:hypothetical protein
MKGHSIFSFKWNLIFTKSIQIFINWYFAKQCHMFVSTLHYNEFTLGPIARSFQQHQRHITIPLLELNGRHSSVTMFSTDFSFPKPGFLEFIWIFSSRTHLKINIFPHSESKSCQINSIKSCSSKSFQQHQRHIHSKSSENFQLWF